MGKNEKKGYQTAAPDRYHILKDHARQMRREMTDAERLLWETLRHNPYRLRFRRQHPIADFIVDFVCLDYMLVIEVDGGYHFTPEQMSDDAARAQILNNMGFSIMRFTNEEVMFQVDDVTRKIYDYLLEQAE